MDELLAKAINQGELIRNFMVNTNKTGRNNQTRGFINSRIELLKNYWSKFAAANEKILSSKSPDANKSKSFVEDDIYIEIEQLYCEHLGQLNDLLDVGSSSQERHHSTPTSPVRNVQPSPVIKLPHITIPNFSGDYSAWTSFHDLFEALVIKNDNLSNVQRLHHLKSFVSGDAEILLRKYSVQENNFEPAWALLKKRYANKRLLINTIFERFLSQPRVPYSSADGLRHLLDTSLECISSIGNLLEDEQLYEALVLHIMAQKLDVKTLEAWEKSIQGDEDPASIEQLTEFLDETCRTMELVNSTKKQFDNRSSNNRFEKKSTLDHKPFVKSFHSSLSSQSSSTSSNSRQQSQSSKVCLFCDKSHGIQECFKFRALKQPERLKYVISKSLCPRCLGQGHPITSCFSSRSCSKCNKSEHHTLLHNSPNSETTNQTANFPSVLVHHGSTSAVPSQADALQSSLVHGRKQLSLLPTALISVKAANGVSYTLRALLDTGSEASIICQAVVQLLNIKIQKSTVTLKGIGHSQAGKAKGFIELAISSLHDNTSYFNIDALVLPSLTGLLPSRSFDPHEWEHLRGITLADPYFHSSSKIDIILGSDIYGDILLPGNNLLKGPNGSPVAQLTAFGWIISGKRTNTSASPQNNKQFKRQAIEELSCFSAVSVCEQLQKFWEIEEISTEKEPTSDEAQCEAYFQKTHHRLPNGRYEVHLPFIASPDLPTFGSTRPQCVSRLRQIQKRFSQNKEMKGQYTAFMDEYVSLGHMHSVAPLPLSKIPSPSFYLPHHAVIKESSSTTKVRIVFDASCKSSDGYSLNDKLQTGPRIQQDLMDILLRWRKHKIVLVSDVEKMYRQIIVTKAHRQFQRIVWQDEHANLQDFELSTVTYGTSCAPYLAVRTLNQLALDEERRFPMASSHTLTDMYVDDFISGANTIEEAEKLRKEMVDMFKSGGFNLRKWSTNCEIILNQIPINDRETISFMDLCKDVTLKTLGVFWHPILDEFQFRINLSPLPCKSTKRTLLSDVSRLFDPLGWLAPVIISAKIMFQQLWLKGLEWDDALPEDVCQAWIHYRSLLPILENIKIPRWINTTKSSNVELHGFCDASLKAYAAVIYIRTQENSGDFKTTLLTSKTRVAPIKRISLPHLELCGATLLAKLLSRVKNIMNINPVKMYAWTDSTIVLAWLRNQTHKQTFVANRVSIILDHLQPSHWVHVRSADNAADIASRGICPSRLKDYSLWWHGPKWLQYSSEEWPKLVQDVLGDHQPASVETAVIATTTLQLEDDIMTCIKRFSSYHRLIRTMAYCLRFVNNCRRVQNHRKTSFLDAEEHRNALHLILKSVQLYSFANEITSIQKSTNTSNWLSILNPFISEKDGLLRVGGRLNNAPQNYDFKYPIILPRDNHFSRLLIEKIHKDALHSGTKLTLATLRTSYWIPSVRATIRKIIYNCKICHRHSANIKNQLMGALPSVRVTPSKAFNHTGVDYAGPIDLRLSKHRGRGTFKGYIVVFVCLSSKAIHLELASDLSTKCFLAAFSRFTARRGLCSNVYSDNGTNFVGANKQLKLDFIKCMSEIETEVATTLALKEVKWHFIPPGSPHFGGLWEASVKSMKFHLKRIMGQSILTFEELYTLLVQIEGTLNSRPLCQLSSEIDLQALSPAHLLTGGPIVAVPQPSLLNFNENRLDRWKILGKLHQDFWKSWSVDYLSDLQQRPKRWSKAQRNLMINDIVVVKNELLPPSSWLLARVIDTHPGEDGIVRVVTVRHQNGQFKRPVSKLCYLPTHDWNQDQKPKDNK